MRNLFSLALILFVSETVWAQLYPAYHVTVDTNNSVGYYFITPVKFGGGANASNYQMILDKQGNVVYTKNAGRQAVSDFKIQPNGLMSYNTKGKSFLLDSTFTEIDSLSCRNGITTDGHDLQILSNGNYLLMGTEDTIMDLSAYHVFNHNGTPGSATATVKCGVIQELDMNKHVVFEWHSKDYYHFNDVDTSFLNAPNLVDWTHFNAVEQDIDGHILVSVRHFNEVTKFNHVTGNIIWRLGGNANQFTFLNDTAHFLGQHDIRRISNGNYTVYDNGRNGSPMHPAQAKEYTLNENNFEATLAWNYVNNLAAFSLATGNVQRISNGNTVISYGALNVGAQTFNVVDTFGVKHFELVFDDTLISYRAFNYPLLPFTLQRPQLTCINNNGQYYLTTTGHYNQYVWNTGDTLAAIPVSNGQTYQVFVPIGNGGYISSEILEVTDINNLCGITNVKSATDYWGWRLVSNNVGGQLTILFDGIFNTPANACIYNVMGSLVKQQNINAQQSSVNISTQNLAPGMYLLRFNGTTVKFTKY
jgi:hypothetical protein